MAGSRFGLRIDPHCCRSLVDLVSWGVSKKLMQTLLGSWFIF